MPFTAFYLNLDLRLLLFECLLLLGQYLGLGQQDLADGASTFMDQVGEGL
ncbi:hypothetical protein [Ruficoccus sp. ZRK36]|nr:hypothetical protein [Ruficoccus sp. ZRK36]QYY34792.1 hypothetical protein K0V07_10815 [Ruficoccus sp. ZRK36]